MEEETGEHFERVLRMLDDVQKISSPQLFFQSIWLIMLSLPSARGSSLNLLLKRLPKFKADEGRGHSSLFFAVSCPAPDVTGIAGKDVGLMIRALSSAMEDDNLLVRRAALDILNQSVPANGQTMKRCVISLAVFHDLKLLF